MAFRDYMKGAAILAATVVVLPALVSFRLRSLLLGANRALEGSTQALSLVPGLVGQYLRRAFLTHVLADCHTSVTVEFGTIFSEVGATIGENVYIGAHCQLGLVHIEREVLIAGGVHIPSGAHTHGFDDLNVPIREQSGRRTPVTIGAGSWIGSGAIILADVGHHTIVAAGAVVTKTLPPATIAGGMPARVLRARSAPNAEPADPPEQR